MRKASSLIILFLLAVNTVSIWGMFQIRSQKDRVDQKLQVLEKNHKLAVQLVNKQWYIVDQKTVSSEKDGQGTIVQLPSDLESKCYYGRTVSPIKNLRVMFVPLFSENDMYVIAGDLTYAYGNGAGLYTDRPQFKIK